MALVALSLLKAHVRADDFTEDDEYLSSVLESAELWVVQATARTEPELLELGGGVLPPQLRQAVLLVAGHWYNQREAVGSSTLAEVPYTVQALVKPFRRLVADSQDTDTGDPEPDTATLTIIPDPGDATVVIDGIERQSVTVDIGTVVSWAVSADGYYTKRGTVTVDGDTSLPVTLTEKDGVSVAYTDSDGVRRICAPSEWREELGTAAGVLVEDGEHSILVAPAEAESTMQWGLYGTLIDGVTTTTNSAEAQADFEGNANTEACVAAGMDETCAAGWCDAYPNGGSGEGKWWLPACGDLYNLIFPHITEVNETLTAIGGNPLSTSSYYWSSTQYNANAGWGVSMYNGGRSYYNKGNTYGVRAVSEWNYEE